MQYLALYRKYRPKKFSEVVGQHHIVKTLQNQIITGRISHAYLFCGTRGTGKTSIAKIFAMAVNCFDNQNGEPCFECESCQNTIKKQNANIIEIDAASNNGVDNIRDIRDEVKYPPIGSKYKVYIIDEVHMLSAGAFNALLKTLEEPPEHVIFILATTDPQKIPATIHSRCQRFDFKRILPQEMFEAIKKYMADEKIKITDEAINYIIHASDGAMRDALSILDECISFNFEEEIDEQKVINMIGNIDDDICVRFIDKLYLKDSKSVLEIINEVVASGKEITQFVQNLILFLRDSIIIKNNVSNNSNLWKQRIELLEKSSVPLQNQIILLDVFSKLQNELRYAINPQISLEIACIKYCSTEIVHSNLQQEHEIKKSKNPDENSPLEKKIVKKIIPDDIKKLIEVWPKIVSKSNGLLRELLNLSAIGFLKNDTVYIVSNDIGCNSILKQKKSDVKNLIQTEINCDFNLDFICKSDYNNEHKNIYGHEDDDLKKQLSLINSEIIIED